MVSIDWKSGIPLSRRRMLRRGLIAAPFIQGGFTVPLIGAAQPQALPEQWYWWPGHTMTIKATGEETAGTCTWILFENSFHEGVPFHKHLREDESFYVVEGIFEITVGDKSRKPFAASDERYSRRFALPEQLLIC